VLIIASVGLGLKYTLVHNHVPKHLQVDLSILDRHNDTI
jgi:hypothetical protein